MKKTGACFHGLKIILEENILNFHFPKSNSEYIIILLVAVAAAAVFRWNTASRFVCG